MRIRLLGRMDGLDGCVDVWMYEGMDVWPYGCMDVWRDWQFCLVGKESTRDVVGGKEGVSSTEGHESVMNGICFVPYG